MNVGAIKTIVAWAKMRDPNERYNYLDCDDCAAAQYMKDVGLWQSHDTNHTELAHDLGEYGRGGLNSVYAVIFSHLPHTMGGVLDRASALLPKDEPVKQKELEFLNW